MNVDSHSSLPQTGYCYSISGPEKRNQTVKELERIACGMQLTKPKVIYYRKRLCFSIPQRGKKLCCKSKSQPDVVDEIKNMGTFIESLCIYSDERAMIGHENRPLYIYGVVSI